MGLDVAGHTLPWLWLLVDALATYRLVRLVQQDVILDGPRNRILNRWPPHPPVRLGQPPARPRLSTLLVCSWCLSPWIAVVALALTVWAPGVWVWAAVPLAISAVAGYLAERA